MRLAVVETNFGRNVARRDLLTGRWAQSDGDKMKSTVEIASILVQTRPERLNAAARAIEQLSGTQIYGRDPRGKLVVVVEAGDVGGVGATLNIITMLPEVLTAALVFQGTDEA
jgi:periplasmic nitrate reductase NapD